MKLPALTLLIVSVLSLPLWAQETVAPTPTAAATPAPTPAAAPAPTKQLNDQDLVDIEKLYQEAAPQAPTKNLPPSTTPTQQLTADERKELETIQNSTEVQNSRVKSVTELNQLSPFIDVSMIQRKYLPKTERFQLYTALGLSTNSPWFINLGGKINFSYNFTENFGIEGSGMFLTSSERDAAKEIRDNNSLQPERFILTKSHLGADLVWTPIYGKIAKLNQEIIPFDMYFSLGGGISGTNSVEKNVATAHLATGQIFAISKSVAFRWDYSWYLYQATPVPDALSTTPTAKSTYNDLVFTAGISFFFPEANYR